jgi:hypothetical protein
MEMNSFPETGNMLRLTFILGGSWMLVGIAYLAVRIRGFRRKFEVKDIF